MEYVFTTDYLHVDQMNLDKRQWLYVIKKQGLKISIGLEYRPGRLNQGNVKVYDKKIGTEIKEYVPHNGYVDLCDVSFMDPRKSLADLLNGETLNVWQIKCERDGYERFLEPAIPIKFSDCYIHHNEIEKIIAKKTTQKNLKGIRKDVISEALIKKIFPVLKEEEILMKPSKLTMLCWEKLSDALSAIGCSDVAVELKGEKDIREFKATHQNLAIPANSYKAFRRRIPDLREYYLSKNAR